jgi:hypothetical protein
VREYSRGLRLLLLSLRRLLSPAAAAAMCWLSCRCREGRWLRLLRMTLAAAAEFRMQRRRALLALLKRFVRGGELTCRAGWALVALMLMKPLVESDGGAGADAGFSCCQRCCCCRW